MFASEFLFSVCLSGSEAFDDILRDVARTVLGQVGCAAPVITDLVKQLGEAVASVNGSSEVRVQFRGHRGACDVTVHADTRQVWHTRAINSNP